MKLLHLSDLHLGIRLCGYSMIEDQEYILDRILSLCERERPDAVLIAGDVYDRPLPPIEAISLFGKFLSALYRMGIETFIIGGNHDSTERLSFASDLIENTRIHIAPPYEGDLSCHILRDAHGEIAIYLLPFSHLSELRRYFPEQKIASMQDAYAAILAAEPLSPERRNILVCHPFVAGGLPSDSEEISVGGLDVVGASVFDPFDYVALGHLHSPQSIKGERLRYPGTPLAYSFSECGDEKSATMVTLGKKGDLKIETHPLIPKRPLLDLVGQFSELCSAEYAASVQSDAYLRITLTDEEDVPEALSRLRVHYPHICRLRYDNTRTRKNEEIAVPTAVKEADPMLLFSELYRLQNNQVLIDRQTEVLSEAIAEIWGGAV